MFLNLLVKIVKTNKMRIFYQKIVIVYTNNIKIYSIIKKTKKITITYFALYI